MKIFFVNFEVTPTPNNDYYHLVQGALAWCWVQENDAQGAFTKASFFVTRGDWEIKRLDMEPTEVNEQDFVGQDIGLQQYLKAKKEDIAIYYTGWARDGKSSFSVEKLDYSYKFNIGKHLKEHKKLRLTGRCLHYNSGERCDKIINAHSIQKKNSLNNISQNGHVYILSTDISSLRKNNGQPSFKKCGVNKTSTFLGFCNKHDNELFEPIDNSLLEPTDEQVFLYAYRSLCREFFVKENCATLYANQPPDEHAPKGIQDLFLGMEEGTIFGLKNLKRHKSCYDKSLKDKLFHDINYVLFRSQQSPMIAFSGLFYPDFDFLGRRLQNLANYHQNLDLITFCSAPMQNGWGFLFAWHYTSDNICAEFMKSLATHTYNGKNLGDALFRLVVSSCENLAIAPKWWEERPRKQINSIIERTAWATSPFCAMKPSYLQEGLEGIANWEFDGVITTMD